MNFRYLLIITCLLVPSCQKPVETSSKESVIAEESEEGVIDGDAWTLARFSDFFDEDITIDDVKKSFGNDPLIEQEGPTTKLTYALGSQKSHDNGMRIHTIDVIFKDGKFTEFKIGRSGIYE